MFRNGQNPSDSQRSYGMDFLIYDYDEGNKLLGVKDHYGTNSTSNAMGGFKDGNTTGDDYTYDENGNMISDANKGISKIQYNHLNLPKKISFETESTTGKYIEYTYDATGVKLKKEVQDEYLSSSSYTLYDGNYIYEKNTGRSPLRLKFFSHPESYIEPNVTSSGVEMDYVYQYKDHLGNIRLSYKETNQSLSTLVNDDFETELGLWTQPWSGRVSISNGKMKYSASKKWDKSKKYLSVKPGSTIRISFDLINGDLQNPYFFVRERFNGVWEPWADRDLIQLKENGEYVLEITPNADFIELYFEKGEASDDGTTTSFYIDNFKVTKNSSLQIVEENNYYPFGLQHKGYNNVVNGTEHPYKFGGNEYDESLGINSYDFGSRNYNPALGRWFNIDPFAEFMRNQSPYNFGFNNPIYFSDYGGTIPWPLPEIAKILGNTYSRKSTPDEYFGYIKRRRRNHYGLDLNYDGGKDTDYGAPIVATHSGTVVRIIPLNANDGGGRIIVISSPDGSFQTKYMHLSSVAVKAGQEISEGQTIGAIGNSAYGKNNNTDYYAHLHYEIQLRDHNGSYNAINPWNGNQPIDPQQWIPSMGPFRNADAYSFGSSLNVVIPFTELGSANDTNSSSSESSDNSSTKRAKVSSVGTLTPSGLSPSPSILPSGGSINPRPAPAPAPPRPFPKPNCVDC